MAANTWTANRRLYLNKAGTVVEADDPARTSLLVAEGGSLPLEQARALGLVNVTPEVVEETEMASPSEKAKADAPSNKARAKAPENKAQE